MHAKAHDTGKKLHFDSRHQQPIFRHPYEKYNTRISNDSVYRINESNRDIGVKRNCSKLKKRRDIQGGFQDKNIYICQTFLKENPFFGAYYPDARPRSENGEGTSGRGSERSRSVGTDFDDSRTYRVIHSAESNCNEDRSSVTRCKFKKPDDIHHFHEHHHFFHEKEGKQGKESTGNPLIASNISFLKQPIQESCMFYQKDEGPEARKNREGERGVSRSSSKTGRKSSDNETYTVVCEYCKKLLRDYPNARVVGHENLPVRLSNDAGDKRPYVQYCYNGESMQKTNWIPANTFVAEPVQGPSLSRPGKSDRLSKISDESEKSSRSSSPPVKSTPREKRVYKTMKDRGTRRRVTTKKSSNHKVILFKCDHCKSIIQFPYVFRVLKSSSSSSCSSEEVLRRVTANGKTVPKPRGITTAVMRRSNISTDRKSTILEESQSSVSDTRKSFSPKASLTMEKARSSSLKASTMKQESYREIQGKKISSSLDKKSGIRESKRVPVTKESVEIDVTSKESPVFEEAKTPKKKSSSAYKVPKDSSVITKKKSSCCGDSEIVPDESEENEEPVNESRKESRKNSVRSVDKKISTSRRDLGVSSKRAVGTEVYLAKVEGKQKVILTKERSMQTSSGKFVAADEGKTPKRSVDATTDTKQIGTAPGGLVNKTRKESSVLRGGSAISRRTVASKEVPIIGIDPIPEANPELSGIQNEISDLKSQLYRLEAMHNMTETEIDGNHEAADYPKHPIVVCTSTTYIMTNYGVENDEKYPKGNAKPKESIKIPSKKKDSASEFGLHVESTPPRPKRVYVGQMRVVRGNPDDKSPSRAKCYDHGNCPGKDTTPNCQIIGDRIAKAVNRICQCSNRDLLSRYREGSKSCDRGDEYRRLFGNGKNQKRMWTGNGASIDDCCMKFAGNMESHCRWHSVDFDQGEVLKAIASIRGKEGLLSFRSCSAVFGGRKFPVSCEKINSKATPGNGIIVENVRIEGGRNSGYFLRTSVSDICEYRNGSLIRLTGKSGWVVLTKKLYLQKTEKGRDNFVLYPAITSKSPSAITIKKPEGDSLEPEGSEDLFADYDLRRDRNALSDSSIYLPLTLRDYNAGRTSITKEKGVSRGSVYLPRNVRRRNRGTADVRRTANKHFSDELHLMNCRSAADRTATCGVGSEGDGRCTCRQERRSQREGDNVWKRKNEAVPVLFEEMKTTGGVAARKQPSDVSLKCVFAETLRDKRTGSKVFWTSDWCDSRNKNKYVFAVSRSGRSRSNKEQFSMSDRHRKRKWHRYTTSRKSKESSGRDIPKEDTLQGDSPVNQPNRCACCNCSPQHVCSGPNDKREEISGFRRLLKDVGLAGINLNFLRKLHCDRVVRRPEVQVRRKEEVRKKVEVDDFREEVRNSYSSLKSYGPKSCDCAKQIEELLNKVELCRPPQRTPPPVSKNETLEEESEEEEGEEEESSKSSPSPTKILSKESEVNEVILSRDSGSVAGDIGEQQRRIEECENMLKKFEMKLEEVRRHACTCDETVHEKPVEKEVAPHHANVQITTEEEEIVTKKKTEDRHVNTEQECCPSKIEILCERKTCTCQQCSNIHYIDKHYLPTAWIKNCRDENETGSKAKCSKPASEVSCKPKREGTPKMEDAEANEEKLIRKSDLDKGSGDMECDKNGPISCECTIKGDKGCDCDSKLKMIEARLRALETNKKPPEKSSTSWEDTEVSGAGTGSEKKKPPEGDTDVSSWENIESETDNEVKTKVITCNNLQFFVGGDPNIRTKCQCTEELACPFRFIPDENVPQTKNIYFVTNIELLRHWSGLYDYKYCKSFWNGEKPAIKPVKNHRDWRNVKSAVTSFFRKKRYNIFKRKKAESIDSVTATSVSVESFINDCSRSSMPLKKRSFHILSDGPHPTRPGMDTPGSKRKRRRNR